MTDHRPSNGCLSDEILTLWTQGLLSAVEAANVRAHLDNCEVCREVAGTLESLPTATTGAPATAVPESVASSARAFIARAWESNIARIILTFRDGLYTSAQTTGEILLAPWLPPTVSTRAPGTDPSSVVIETVYRDLRCRVESIRTAAERHTVKAAFFCHSDGRPIEPSLVILYDNDDEIESQMSVEGRVVFEDLPEGTYRLTMTLPDGRPGHLDLVLVPSQEP